jgi:hypothetical protein
MPTAALCAGVGSRAIMLVKSVVLMCIRCLLILQLLVSLPALAQVPGNARLLDDRYECIESADDDLPAWVKTAFPRPTLLRPEQPRGTVFNESRTTLKHITPPPEFRGQAPASVDRGGLSRLIPRGHFCHGTGKAIATKALWNS